MSTVTTYKPHPDPWHGFEEGDPLGDAAVPGQAPYSISKIAEEAVARYCARSFNLPITIARMGAAYGQQGGMPVWHLQAIAAGQPVKTRWDPMTYSPIHDDDIVDQLDVPVLILHGDRDMLTPVSRGRDLRTRIADAEIWVFAGCTHAVVLEFPERVSRHLLDFLSRRVYGP